MSEGLDFDADMAATVGMMRDRKMQDVFDKILHRCLIQIQRVCETQISTVYIVPEALSTEFQPYNLDDVVAYLIVALRDDRGFRVEQVNRNTLYIRWPRGEQRRKQTTAVPVTVESSGTTGALDTIKDLVSSLK